MSQIFNVTTNRDYPNETYTSSVVTSFSDINGNQQTLTNSKSALQVISFLRYQKNSTNEIINFLDAPYYNNLFTFKNCTYNLNLDQTYLGEFGEVPTIKFSNNPTITLNISALRQTYKTPSEFYLFYYTITGETKNFITPSDSYGYMIYPFKITLKPIGSTALTKTTNGWSLSTNITRLSSVVKYLSSSNLQDDAINFHKNYYLKNPDNFLKFEDLPSYETSNFNITPLISANRNIIDKPLINYSSINNPSSAKFILESSSENYINLDSTNLTYFIKYTTPVGVTPISSYFVTQTSPDVYPYKNFQNFTTSHIILYNPIVYGNKQLFKIAQYKANPAAYLGDSTNCILSAIIDFDDNTLLYYANTAIYRLGSANFDIPFAISYNVDSPYILNGKTVKSTLNSIELKRDKPNKNTWTTLKYGNSIDTGGYNDNILIFNTDYPPHYYSYKIELRDASNKYLDSNKLNFYLTTVANEPPPRTTYNILKTYIKSDFNILTYDFDRDNTAANDLIKYTFYEITSGVYDDLKITYGPNINNQDFTIQGETYSTTKYLSGAYGGWVPILSGKDLKIDYVGAKLGKANLTVRATISTVAGEMDAFEATNITLAEDIKINPIILNVLDEKSNIIYIDSSVNSVTSQWPGRCLSGVDGAYISWNFTPYNPNVTIFAVDSELNYIQDIIPNTALLWDSNTYTVCVSGFGDQDGYTTKIYLSSQFYDETSTVVIPNSSLFDYFHENKFIIAPVTEIDNLEKTRKIKLIAKVPYGNALFNIPITTPIYWTWQYDSNVNPITQPITAYNDNISDYSYATNQLALSAREMNFNIMPGNNSKLNYHDITVKIYSDIRNPSISGSYKFAVDDFPSYDIFNTDFTTEYYDYQSTIIADTRIGKNTITRSNDKNKKFIFKPNTDVLSKLVYDSYSLFWTLSNKSVSLVSRDLNFSYDLASYPELLTTVTLNLTGAYAPGWINAHNTSTTTYIYLLPPSEFNKPIKFRAFPEFAWLNSPYLTLLNANNYTLIGSATANYGNTKTNSISFWLSANKDYFTQYNYQSLSNKIMLQTENYYDLVDIPYDVDNVYSDGLPISLTAYNDTYYPLINGITYQEPNDGDMQTYYFNNFTQTLNNVDVDNDKFRLTPKVLPYNDLILTFDVVNPNSTLNLDTEQERIISITQNLATFPVNSPAIAVGGTITYILSSRYWSASADVPISNGTYDLFTLRIGDPFFTLYTGELGIENFVLYNVANITQQIPESTFKNVTYNKNKDLWEAITL